MAEGDPGLGESKSRKHHSVKEFSFGRALKDSETSKIKDHRMPGPVHTNSYSLTLCPLHSGDTDGQPLIINKGYDVNSKVKSLLLVSLPSHRLP